MIQRELEIELMIAQETILEAEEAFDKLRKHTDRLESILKKHNISFPEFWGW